MKGWNQLYYLYDWTWTDDYGYLGLLYEYIDDLRMGDELWWFAQGMSSANSYFLLRKVNTLCVICENNEHEQNTGMCIV